MLTYSRALEERNGQKIPFTIVIIEEIKKNKVSPKSLANLRSACMNCYVQNFKQLGDSIADIISFDDKPSEKKVRFFIETCLAFDCFKPIIPALDYLKSRYLLDYYYSTFNEAVRADKMSIVEGFLRYLSSKGDEENLKILQTVLFAAIRKERAPTIELISSEAFYELLPNLIRTQLDERASTSAEDSLCHKSYVVA